MTLLLEHVLPFEVYSRLVHTLKVKTHVHVDLIVHSKDTQVDMVNLDQYVSYFCGKRYTV